MPTNPRCEPDGAVRRLLKGLAVYRIVRRYQEFKHFMIDVIDESDRKSRVRYSKSLEDLCQLTDSILDGLKIILKVAGWPGFIAVATLLALGPAAFGVSLTSFTITPMGWVIIGALTAVGGAYFVKVLYRNRLLSLAIKEVGSRYKERYSAAARASAGEKILLIDSLLDEASDELIRLAMCKLGLEP